jgi:single-stranded-DNA-specific exonuclease
VYGDYDADGITGTAIMWEALFKMGLDVMPHIPVRSDEGYGLNEESIKKLISKYKELGLIITVDNGIVATSAVNFANKNNIDVIITDHHVKEKKIPKAKAIIHTTKIAGSAVSWVLTRELGMKGHGLELAAIGTISDQMPLIGPNRSFAKFGLKELNKTKRIGLLEMFKEAKIEREKIGVYEVNFMIAPRINAMGRLAEGIDSLRLLCTKDKKRAKELAKLISSKNSIRQSMVEDMVVQIKKYTKKTGSNLIFLSDEKYHEGIIGLAAGKIVEELYKPAIVISKGKEYSKGSARSVSGFSIIEAIRKHSDLLVAHGGHVMAAGFTIKTANIKKFEKAIKLTARKMLTQDMLTKKLKIDCELNFNSINWDLLKELKKFEPFGIGNPSPIFASSMVTVEDARLLGKEKTHLKLKLKKDNRFFDAIAFGFGQNYKDIKGKKINLAFSVEENIWNGSRSLQLKIKDITQPI